MSESPVPLEELRRIAAGREPRVVAADGSAHGAADDWHRHGLARGRLHELFAAEPEDAGAGAGAALALAQAAGALPLLWLRTEGAERQAGRLHAGGLAELGVAPDSLLLGLVPDEAALLRAGADAARCAGLGTLLVEAWGRAPGLDLTATRRLMLAAEASGVTVLLLRVAATPVPSAAATRWQVAALPSAALAIDAPGAPAPGLPAFAITCLRRRGGPSGQRWCVEWNRETRCFAPQIRDTQFTDTGSPDIPVFATAPLSGAGLPLAADRAAALDPPAPVRRAG